jgi:Zn-dependent M28 family amino/carboxypeptidase
MVIQLARYFHWKRSCNAPLANTRLVFCSFDAEEMGLRGSRAWYEQNGLNFESALVLNFDSMYHSDKLTFLERDVNGHQPLDAPLARRCAEIAQSMGYAATCESIPRLSGGTDAAEASRANLRACTLTSVGWDDRTKPAVYHTEDDTVASIDPKSVEMALSVAIRLVELVDQKRLWEPEHPKQEKQKEEESDPKLTFSKLTHR